MRQSDEKKKYGWRSTTRWKNSNILILPKFDVATVGLDGVEKLLYVKPVQGKPQITRGKSVGIVCV